MDNNNRPSKTDTNITGAMGIVKENVGWATGNESLQNSGLELKNKANDEYKALQSQDSVQREKDDLKGSFKESLGTVIDDDRIQYEGRADQLKREANRKLNP